jgi:hypothetical protein
MAENPLAVNRLSEACQENMQWPCRIQINHIITVSYARHDVFSTAPCGCGVKNSDTFKVGCGFQRFASSRT